MFPKFGRCYTKQRSADCELAKADTIQVCELSDIVEHEPCGYVSWWDIANVPTRPMLNLDNCQLVNE